MFIFDITNPLTLILMLIVAILLIFLSRELKKSYIAAIPLCIFLAIAVIHGAQLLTLAEEYKDLAGKLMCCIGIDFILIGITFFGYLWTDDTEAKKKGLKGIDNKTLQWLWKDV